MRIRGFGLEKNWLGTLLWSAVILLALGLEAKPLVSVALNNLGAIQVSHILMGKQAVSNADKILTQAMIWNPHNPQPLKNQALLAYSAGNTSLAIQLWSEVLAQNPHDVVAHIHLGNGWARLNRWQDAARNWADAGAIFQLVEYGQSFVDKQDWETAEQVFREAVRADQANSQAHWGLAISIYRNRQDLDAAVAELLYVIRIHPQEAHTYFELSQLYLESNHSDKALEWAEQMREKFPRDPQGWLAIGLVHLKIGAYEQAMRAYRQMLVLDPMNSRAMFEIGRVYREQSLDAESVPWFEQAVAVDPNLWWYRQYLAEAYARVGQECKAAEQFSAQLQLDPANEYAAKKVKELSTKCP